MFYNCRNRRVGGKSIVSHCLSFGCVGFEHYLTSVPLSKSRYLCFLLTPDRDRESVCRLPVAPLTLVRRPLAVSLWKAE